MARRINAKFVMELLGMGMLAREISRTRGIASASVKKVREAAGPRRLVRSSRPQPMRRPIASRKQMAVSLVNEAWFSSEIEYNIPRKQSMTT